MNEERKGRTNGERRGLRFYARCTRQAWRGAWDAANAWQLVLALLLLSGGGWLAGLKPRYPEIPYSAPIGMGLILSTAWFAVFLVQFVAAPARLQARNAGTLIPARRPAALPLSPIPALPAPEATPVGPPAVEQPLSATPLPDPPQPDVRAAEPPPADLPLLDRPLVAPPMLDLADLGELADEPPPADLPLLDQSLVAPPMLDLAALGAIPDEPPPAGIPLLDRPLVALPMLDLAALGAIPDEPPPADIPLLDRPLVAPPMLDLEALGVLPDEPPPLDFPQIDRSLVALPMLDLAALGALPDEPPPADLPLLDRPLLAPPMLDLEALGALPDEPPPADLPLLDRPLVAPPMLDLEALGALPDEPPPADLPLLDRPLVAPPMLDLEALGALPDEPPPADLPLLDRPLLGQPLLDLSAPDLLPARLPLPPVPTLIEPSPAGLPLPAMPRVPLPAPRLRSERRAPLPARARPALRSALPTIDVRLHDQIQETSAVDTTGDRLPTARAYRARVANRGDETVRRCQLFFCNPMNIQVVSGPFDLAPGEHRDLPALRVIEAADDPHALLYFLDAETWQVAQGQAAWLPEPGLFKVKVLSANAPPSALEVKLLRDAAKPSTWTLVEASDPDQALQPGHEAATWASSDAVAAASLGG